MVVWFLEHGCVVVWSHKLCGFWLHAAMLVITDHKYSSTYNTQWMSLEFNLASLV